MLSIRAPFALYFLSREDFPVKDFALPPKKDRTPLEQTNFAALSAAATSCGNSIPENSSSGVLTPTQ
jgi:hypothetical protein